MYLINHTKTEQNIFWFYDKEKKTDLILQALKLLDCLFKPRVVGA
jgi:hypothetical protein